MTIRRALAALLPLAALPLSGCSQPVEGQPVIGHEGVGVVNIDQVLLSSADMQAITGAGQDLTIIPSMDAKTPVDVDHLRDSVPPECRFVFDETAIFGTDFTDFHKTTYQDPPRGALISQGAAVYRSPVAADAAFDALGATVKACGNSPFGSLLIGEWDVSPTRITTRPGECGRDYRHKSAVLVELTSCAFPNQVTENVMTHILDRIPG